MIKFLLKHNFHVLFVYILLCFPLFYFVYKFGVVLAGYEDAKSYFKLFGNLSSHDVPSPFNMRLLSPALIHILHETGLFYNTECAFDAFPMYDKTYFFANVFYNFICVSLTSHSLYLAFTKLNFSKFNSFLAGLVFLLGFGTIFYLMMPGVDSISLLIFTWILFFYLKRNYWIIPLLLILVFQREYYFLFFMLVALMDFFRFKKEKYYIHVFAIATLGWLTYFVLRKYVFFTHHWHYQTNANSLLNGLLHIEIDLVTMFRQSFMTMNIYFIYLLVLAIKKYNDMKINTYNFITTVLLFIQITILSIATTSGNNNGRYFYFATPYFLYLILSEVNSILRIELNIETK